MLPHCYYSIHPKLIHFFLHVALFQGQVFHFALADILTTALVNHSIILFIYFSLFLSSVIPPSNKRKHKQIFGMKIKVKYKPKLFLSLNITFKVLPSLPSFFLHIFFFFFNTDSTHCLYFVKFPLLYWTWWFWLLSLPFPWNFLDQVSHSLLISSIHPKWFLTLVTLDFLPSLPPVLFCSSLNELIEMRDFMPLFLCPSQLVPWMWQHWGLWPPYSLSHPLLWLYLLPVNSSQTEISGLNFSS